MPEVSQEELDDLRARAAGNAELPSDTAPPAAAEPEVIQISKADLDKLIAQAARAQSAPGGPSEPAEPPQPMVALGADGNRYDFTGMPPTHVAVGTAEIPVLGVYPASF